jgi:hypothetical protein
MTHTVTEPRKTKLLRFWMPIPPIDHEQTLISSEIVSFPDEIKPEGDTKPLYGNRFAFVEFKNPQGAPTIRHPFRVRMDDSQPVPIRPQGLVSVPRHVKSGPLAEVE